MKKRGYLLGLLLLVIIWGCSDQEPNEENMNPGTEHQQNENNMEEPGNDGQKNGDNSADDDEKGANRNAESFNMSALQPEDLENGRITNLPFQIGTPFQEIYERWGIPLDEDYVRGGKYQKYSRINYDYYFFDPEASDSITSIQINPNMSVTMDQIRETLGTPDFDELDDMLSNSWSLTYKYEDYTLFFVGKTEDENSDVLYMFYKSGQ